MAAAAVLTACNEKVIETKDCGSLSVALDYGGEFIEATKAEGGISTNDFTVTINRTADNFTKTYSRYADMPKIIDLTSGIYTVTASSPNTEPAAFNQPIYSGTKEFTISTGQTTSVQMTCILSNMKVTLEPSENFLKELTAFTVTISNGTGSLIWNSTDIRNGGKEGYFTVAPLHVHVDGFRAMDNSKASYDCDITNVQAQDHHVIKLDAHVTGQLGGISITVDTTTNRKDSNVNVPGFDETPVPGQGGGDEPDPEQPDPEQPEEPTDYTLNLVWPANPTLERTELKSDMGDVVMTVNASEGLKKFLVKVSSPSAGFMGAVGAMATYMEGDVAVLDLTDQNTYEGSMKAVLGLAPDTLVGETSVEFNLGGLLPLIIAVGQLGPDDIGSVHTFTMDLTDSKDHTYVKALEFEYKGN